MKFKLVEKFDTEIQVYQYTGPIYKFDTLIGRVVEPLYTRAPSIQKARANFCSQIKTQLNLQQNAQISIDSDYIDLIPDNPESDEQVIEHEDGSYAILRNNKEVGFFDSIDDLIAGGYNPPNLYEAKHKNRKNQRGALLGIDPFHPKEKTSPIIPDKVAGIEIFNHNMTFNDASPAGSTTSDGASGGTGGAE